MKTSTLVILLLLSITQVGLSSEIQWLTLNVNLRYSDSQLSCNNFSNSGNALTDGSANLSLEVEGTTVIAAQLNNYRRSWSHIYGNYKNLRLTSADLKNIQLYKDEKGNVFLKEWTPSDAALKWLAFYSTELAVLCHPPQLLKTINPTPVSFHFETEGISAGIAVSYSDWKNFSGYRLDNRAYQLSLQIVQTQYSIK